jgi:hypothetical protein
LKRRSSQHIVMDSCGVVTDAFVPNSTAGYLWTIVGERGQVSQAKFARELYGEDCLDPRHSRDWLNWHTRPNAQTAWEIGEALHRAGVRHASGLLMLLAASRLSAFVATFVGLDPEIVEKHADHLAYLLDNGLIAVRGILLDSTPVGDCGLLGGDEDLSTLLTDVNLEPAWKPYAPYIDIEREAENHRLRAAARAVWNMHPEVRQAVGESFACWRQNKRRLKTNERRAACAMAVAEEKRMHPGEREDLVIEALLHWLRERIVVSMQPADPWPVHLAFEW